MTPEQIEELKDFIETGGPCECSRRMHLLCQTALVGLLRALLAEWGDRGREIAALRDEVVRLRHEVERRKAELVAAETKLARVSDIVREVRENIQNCGDAVWNATKTCDEILIRLKS